MSSFWTIVVIVLAIAYIIVAWAGLIYIIRRGLGPYFHSKRQRHTQVNAVIKHRIGQEDFHPVDWQIQTVRKILVFECEDGVDRDYDVPDQVWDLCKQGDDGVLEFQGHLFVDFHARRPRYDLNDVFGTLTRS